MRATSGPWTLHTFMSNLLEQFYSKDLCLLLIYKPSKVILLLKNMTYTGSIKFVYHHSNTTDLNYTDFAVSCKQGPVYCCWVCLHCIEEIYTCFWLQKTEDLNVRVEIYGKTEVLFDFIHNVSSHLPFISIPSGRYFMLAVICLRCCHNLLHWI